MSPTTRRSSQATDTRNRVIAMDAHVEQISFYADEPLALERFAAACAFPEACK